MEKQIESTMQIFGMTRNEAVEFLQENAKMAISHAQEMLDALKEDAGETANKLAKKSQPWFAGGRFNGAVWGDWHGEP